MPARSAPPFDRAVAAIAGITFLAHMAVSGRHGFFRDELYFIDCGRHPALGYVDQPPLVPLVAAATQAFGHSLVLLRTIPAASHAAAAIVTAALAKLVAREAGTNGRFAAPAAAAALALSPMMLGLHTTLSTTAFETLAWTFVAYAAARIATGGDPRWLTLAGIAVGIDLEIKYAVPLFAAPLLLGFVAGPGRRALFTREALVAGAIAGVLAAPSLVWQWTHGLPFRDLMRAAANGKNVVVPPLPFLGNQIMAMNPALAPMWIGGVAWSLAGRGLARVRFLGVGFVAVLAEMILLHGKDYYVAPAYGVAFALGAAGMERLVPWRAARALYAVPVAAFAVVGAPLAMPILSPPSLARYMRAIGAAPQAQENNQKGEALPQLQADMLGWPELEASVAAVWRTLSDDERAHTAIVASNYGEAGALNFFGPRDGLPRAVSGHNSYFVWGPGGSDPAVILRLNGKVESWKDDCAEARIAGRFGDSEYVMPYEHDRPILLCRGAKISLSAEWGSFKHVD